MSDNSKELLTHNRITLEEVEAYLRQNKNCCVVNTCGSGKTSVMAALVKCHPDRQFVIFTKQKNAAKYYKTENSVFCRSNICIATYNQMHTDVKKGETQKYKADYYLADEAHYLGAARWKQSFLALVNEWHPQLVGFTATPQRFEDQGTTHTIIDDFFDDNSAGNFTSEKLEEKGLFVKPEYVLSVYNMGNLISRQIEKIYNSDLSNAEKEKFHSRLNLLQNEWEKTGKPDIVLKKYLPAFMYKSKCNRILVYMSSVQEVNQKKPEVDRMIRDIFQGKRVRSYVYTYQTSEENLQKFLKEDNAYIKVLYTIDKIMETIHIPDLRITIMLRPSVSNRIITQQFGRINNIGNKQKPLIIDMVGNLDKLNRYTAKPTGITEQDRRSTDDSNRLNFNLPCIQKAFDVFKAIDESTKKVKPYTYQGFTGCLNDICYVFCRNTATIKSLLVDYDLETAMEMTKPKITDQRETVVDSLDPDKRFVMTSEQKEYAEKMIHIYSNFLERRKITDEDLCQSLYIAFCYAIYRNWGKESVNMTTYIINSMRRYYLNANRRKFLQENLKDQLAVLVDPYPEEIEVESISRSFATYKLMAAMDTLTEREKTLLMLRFGFLTGPPATLEEAGRYFSISKERARQIEAKAIRKLRHPSRIKMLKDFIS